MSVHTTFPDAIVFPDGTIRLVTDAAKQWAYTNTNCSRCGPPGHSPVMLTFL